MKRKILKFKPIHLVWVCLVLYACQDEWNESSLFSRVDREKAVLDAKSMYARRAPETVYTRAVKEGPVIRVQPEWSLANVESNRTYLAVEVALLSEYNFIFMYPQAKEMLLQTNDSKYKTSQTRFVFLTDKKRGDTDMFLMSIVPHPIYLEKTGFKPYRKMRYLSRDDQFSGMILYHNLEGEFVNGYQYEEGEITHTISASQREEPDIPIITTRGYCEDYYLEYLVEICGSWDVNGEYGGTDCYSYTEWQYWYTQCGGGGGDGGYGGGGGSGGVNDKGEDTTWAGAYSVTAKISETNAQRRSDIKSMIETTLEFLLGECTMTHIYNYLNENGIRFSDVIVDSNSKYPGTYDPDEKSKTYKAYTVQKVEGIRTTIFEEYIHMFQDEWYTGIHKYASNGRANIEFEAKLIQDLSKIYSGRLCEHLGKGQKYGDQYIKWLHQLTNHGDRRVTINTILEEKYQGLGYWDFVHDLNNKDHNLPVREGLEPKALQRVINHFC